MLAAAPVAAVQEGSDSVLPFISNFDRGPGSLGEVKGQPEKAAFFRQPRLEGAALGRNNQCHRPGQDIGQDE